MSNKQMALMIGVAMVLAASFMFHVTATSSSKSSLDGALNPLVQGCAMLLAVTGALVIVAAL